MKVCVRCGCRIITGRAAVHLSGECQLPWYQAVRAKHPRKPGDRLSDEQKRLRRAQHEARDNADLPPELIERIMARRAREQRYERAMAQGGVAVHEDDHNLDGL